MSRYALMGQLKNVDGIAIHKAALTAKPAKKPIRAPRPVAVFVINPKRKTPRIGPLMSEPTLFTATITVDAISSTKKAVTSANIPQNTVSVLPHQSSCAGVAIRSFIAGFTKSFKVVADKLLITESSDDMAAASSATTANPTTPTGNSRKKRTGSAML